MFNASEQKTQEQGKIHDGIKKKKDGGFIDQTISV